MRPRMMITEDHMITSADNAPATTESSSVNIHTFMQLFYLRINDIKTSAPGSSLKYLSHFLFLVPVHVCLRKQCLHFPGGFKLSCLDEQLSLIHHFP